MTMMTMKMRKKILNNRIPPSRMGLNLVRENNKLRWLITMGNHRNRSSRNELSNNRMVSILTDSRKIIRKTQMTTLMNTIEAVEVKMMIQKAMRVIITMMTMMKITKMMIVRWMIVKGKEDRGLKIESGRRCPPVERRSLKLTTQ